MNRYARQIVLPELGLGGQERLRTGSVLIVGLGGLGSPAALYLAAAGIGRLGLADFDQVAESNLQRQILHDTAGAVSRRSKLDSAEERLRGLNPDVQIERHESGVAPMNAMAIVGSYDVVIDASDNFATRFLLNDACHLAGCALVHGSVYQFEGLAAVFKSSASGPCYRCLHRDPPPAGSIPGCSEAGVLGALCGIVGSWQALSAVRLIGAFGDARPGRVHRYDALSDEWTSLLLHKDPQCPLCGTRATIVGIDPKRYGGLACDSTGSEVEIARKVEDAFIVDVREPVEALSEPIAGSILIPEREIVSRADSELPRDREVVLVCASGFRSLRATQELRRRGWLNVRSLQGGIGSGLLGR